MRANFLLPVPSIFWRPHPRLPALAKSNHAVLDHLFHGVLLPVVHWRRAWRTLPVTILLSVLSTMRGAECSSVRLSLGLTSTKVTDVRNHSAIFILQGRCLLPWNYLKIVDGLTILPISSVMLCLRDDQWLIREHFLGENITDTRRGHKPFQPE